jgi:hypothetical protein
MFWIGKLVFIYGVVALGIFGLVTRSVFATFVKPPVDLSPTCGPAELGLNIVICTNGFAPNRTAAWKFVGSDSKIPLYGYIETNSTGGFNDVTFADDLNHMITRCILLMMSIVMEHSILELREYVQR